MILPEQLPIDTLSTVLFSGLCLLVAFGFLALHGRPSVRFLLGWGLWLTVPLGLAASGVSRQLLGTPGVGAYLLVCNGVALACALSTLGQRVLESSPVWVLVGFHCFRLPLELLLHHWFKIGVVPIQMTYSGLNYDIVTGVLAIAAALSCRGRDKKTQWWLVCGFNLVGSALLITVMGIAARSIPWPLRGFMDEPALLLPFYAPYTWIVSVCVAGAFWAHGLTFRWLWVQRQSIR
ncbi:MAG: hypothetical protein AAFQ82_07670 [Myxococcota bacterium]